MTCGKEAEWAKPHKDPSDRGGCLLGRGYAAPDRPPAAQEQARQLDMGGPAELADRAQLGEAVATLDQHRRIPRPAGGVAADIGDFAARGFRRSNFTCVARAGAGRIEQHGGEAVQFLHLQRIAEQIAVKGVGQACPNSPAAALQAK